MISGTHSACAERLPRGHPNPIASSVATHIDGPCGTVTGPAVCDTAGTRVRDLCRLRRQRGRGSRTDPADEPWPDSLSIAGLQARAGLDAGRWSERDMAAVSQAHRADGASIDDLLAAPYVADPLREHDCAPITDGAAAIVLAVGDRARELCERPAWITGMAHRIDSSMLGGRDLTVSPSTRAAAEAVTGGDTSGFDIAELHAPFSHQELILAEAIGLDKRTRINPSGGALAGNPMFAAGLERIGFAAREIMAGSAERALAHATSGPALQQNLVTVLDSEAGR
ncbi:hypothetical protein [Nocardia cyriacigeorgica]|uniref:hypothetical protein n=1 Tax=Nocardia cyriacigeorgica TaxID=135487 RepID=UPI003EE07680